MDRAYGFPLKALWGGEDTNTIGDRSTVLGLPKTIPAFRSTTMAWYGDGYFRLPYGVLPTGFAVDTMTYAVIVFGSWQGPAWFMRRRFMKVAAKIGRCRVCRYNLHGIPVSSPCPECGTPQASEG